MTEIVIEGQTEFVEKALEILKKYRIKVSEDAEIVVSIGGDGTTLSVYRKRGKPILPVRTPKSLGYISDVGIENFDKICEKLISRDFYIEKRIMLDVFRNGKKVETAVNEVAIMQVPKEAMRFSVYANGKPLFGYEKIMGDGLIVSTPTGSTGYNRSAGGYILEPNCNKIVVTLRYPIFLEAREERSKVIEDTSIIDFIFYRPDEAFMVVDNNFFKIKKFEKIEIRKSKKAFELVKLKGLEESREAKEKRRKEWFERQEF